MNLAVLYALLTHIFGMPQVNYCSRGEEHPNFFPDLFNGIWYEQEFVSAKLPTTICRKYEIAVESNSLYLKESGILIANGNQYSIGVNARADNTSNPARYNFDKIEQTEGVYSILATHYKYKWAVVRICTFDSIKGTSDTYEQILTRDKHPRNDSYDVAKGFIIHKVGRASKLIQNVQFNECPYENT